jgi:hypothetical protein
MNLDTLEAEGVFPYQLGIANPKNETRYRNTDIEISIL